MLRCPNRFIAYLSLCALAMAADPPGVRLDVPFVRQPAGGCGAAAIAMVMDYWQLQQGQPATANAEAIQHALYSRRARGIYAADMQRYLGQHGFRTFAIQGEWNDLKHHLEMGRPLIVAIQPARGDFHYVVVTGLDWQQELVLKNDPAERKLLQQHRSEFEREWKAAGNWTLLAVPEQRGEPSTR